MNRFQNIYSPQALISWAVTFLGLLAALYIGTIIPGENIKFLAMIFAAVIAVTFTLAIGRYYWLLIPALSALTGSISILPLPFNYAELGIVAAIGLFVLHLSLKKIHVGIQVNTLDLLLYANLIWLLITYARMPIGLRISGSDMVGARDYLNALLAFGGYLVLSHARVGPKLARVFPLIIAIPMIVASLIMVITQYYPPLSRLIHPFYSGVSLTDFTTNASTSTGGELGRISGFQTVGPTIILVLCSYYAAITLFLPTHPLRFAAFIGSLITIFLSGFRSMVVYVAAIMAISTMLRRRWSDLFGLFVGGVMMLVLFIILQTSGFQMPYGAQRALSFLPFVEWDSEAVRAAEGSTEWRIDMWKIAWEDKTIIKNKLLGDGFGFSLADWSTIMNTELGTGPGFVGGSAQEGWLLRGSFHSGPLSTIRVVGVIGLLVLTITMFYMVFYAINMVNLAKNTPYFAWSIFLGASVVYTPFDFFFIFGGYNLMIKGLIMNIAYMKLLSISLAEWKQSNTEVAQKAERADESSLHAPAHALSDS